jgi:hypothetical protein
MPMPKKANGANLKLGDGDIQLRFEADGAPVVYVVCLWGAKPEFGGQRTLLWQSEQLTSTQDGDSISIPPNIAMAGMQVTWSGGLIARGEEQGALHVTVSQGDESETYSYEYHFGAKNETDSFYDGLNLA